IRLGLVDSTDEYPHVATVEDPGVLINLEPGIDNGPLRLTGRLHLSYGELGIVTAHGADARQRHAAPRAPVMAVGSREGAGDPLRLAARERRMSVQGHPRLHTHPGQTTGHAGHEPDIKRQRLIGTHAYSYCDAGVAQAGHTLPAH